MEFELLTSPRAIQRIAIGRQIRVIKRLREAYGRRRWRKLKGIALIRLPNGRICWAEVHWYEADGVGRREMKIKRLLDRRQEQ